MPGRRPDFLGVGAPKCGTTALHQSLRQHPALFVPALKEPHFFATDVPIRRHLPEADYLELFTGASADQLAGEISVWYLYSRRSAAAIRDWCGPIKILAMLRDPVEAMASLHAQYLFNGDENIESFSLALRAESVRAQGGPSPPGAWVGPQCLCYRRVFSYAEQIERYLRVFGEERVHVTLFEDFVADPGRSVAAIHRFLGVEPRLVASGGPVNPRKEVRFPALRDFHRRHESRARRLARRLLPARRLRRGAGRLMMQTLRRLNSRPVPPTSLAPELLRRLREEMAPGIRRLEDLIGRDLSGWLG